MCVALKKIGKVPIIVFDGAKVESVASNKCLAVVFDSNLNWNNHIIEPCDRISSQIGMIGRLSIFLPIKILRLPYVSLIHSRLSYCMGIWGSANKTMSDCKVLP